MRDDELRSLQQVFTIRGEQGWGRGAEFKAGIRASLTQGGTKLTLDLDCRENHMCVVAMVMSVMVLRAVFPRSVRTNARIIISNLK